MGKISVFWFRRDLRLEDNTGLFHALNSGHRVFPLFIFDSNILDALDDKQDARLDFIHLQLTAIDAQLKKLGSGIITFYGDPIQVWKQLLQEYEIQEVYTNHDYEPYATLRDNNIDTLLASKRIAFKTFKDQVIFEKAEIVKDDGLPYTVFTPYKNKWLKTFTDSQIKSFKTDKFFGNFLKIKTDGILPLSEMGFKPASIRFPEPEIKDNLIREYGQKRDYPATPGTSRISIHLRFGTVSIRKLVSRAIKLKGETWLNELIWREFYMMILWHFPYVADGAFKKQYNKIPWRNNEVEFQKWCDGMTGYPIVDAGMRELNTTGFMHNRVRMITASFLVKHLLIDWRWGEAYFAKKLLDFDLSANNGGWQWAASSGCDAAPYFRIFNPTEQTKRFDPNFEYIRKWVPEFQDFSYPIPIVDHKFARERCLDVYKKALVKE